MAHAHLSTMRMQAWKSGLEETWERVIGAVEKPLVPSAFARQGAERALACLPASSVC